MSGHKIIFYANAKLRLLLNSGKCYLNIIFNEIDSIIILFNTFNDFDFQSKTLTFV